MSKTIAAQQAVTNGVRNICWVITPIIIIGFSTEKGLQKKGTDLFFRHHGGESSSISYRFSGSDNFQGCVDNYHPVTALFFRLVEGLIRKT